MSNPQTYYMYNNLDLSSIFQPISLGTAYPNSTGFKIADGQDFNQVFADISSGSNIGYNIGYSYNGKDLSQIFAAYNPSTYNITNQTNMNVTTINYGGYTALLFENNQAPNGYTIRNATCNITFNVTKQINTLIVGGGGGGACGNSGVMSGGGGGGGGLVYPVFENISGSAYSIQVGQGGLGNTGTDRGANLSNGYDGQQSFLKLGSLNLIAYGGGGGYGLTSPMLTYSGGAGGNATSSLNNTDGSGGSGGGGAYILNSNYNQMKEPYPTPGALNGSYNLGDKGNPGWIYADRGTISHGGRGGNNTRKPAFPFLSYGEYIYISGGGGGGGGGGVQSDGVLIGGGWSGTGLGGGNWDRLYGKSAVSGMIAPGYYFYGNGGGGGSLNTDGFTPDYGGYGGNGVVILWWLN